MTTSSPISPDARPRLRRHLEASPNGQHIVIQDSRRIGRPIAVSQLGLEIAKRLDGLRTLVEIQSDLLAVTGGALVPMDIVLELVGALEERLLLDSPRVKALFEAPVRTPVCVPRNLDLAGFGEQLCGLFTAPGGAGLPAADPPSRNENLRAVLLPHMDYGRGNITYGYGFKELIEKTAAKLFVVIATSHYSIHRFILTRQHFDTPHGVVETDIDYVNKIAARYGDGLFDDIEAHAPEHSIELEVMPLKFLRGNAPFRIVPLLVGSFRDCVESNASPSGAEDIARMVQVLREVEAESTEPVCYVISGDLAHIGPKFRDRRKAAGPWLTESRSQDEAIVKTLSTADPAAYFDTIAAERDARRICGLPPTWLTLEVAKPRTGKVLHYQQYIDPTGYESVSFASAAFYG